MKRIGIIGAGKMAFIRGKCLLNTRRAKIIAVASRQLKHARSLAQKLRAPKVFDDYHSIASLKPDALLIEVPHRAQQEIVLWSLDTAPAVLIGGVLALNSSDAREIEDKASKKHCLVEAGFNARYDMVWEKVRDIVQSGQIGKPVIVQSLALFSVDPSSWYYDQKMSGGMPLTHMSYCFINPVRWIISSAVIEVSALANQLLHIGSHYVEQEMCTASLRFENDCLYSMVAGYISPPEFPGWWIRLICTQGGLEIFPRERTLKIYQNTGITELNFTDEPSSFLRQTVSFIEALDGKAKCLNPPKDAKVDVAISEAIVRASKNHNVVHLANN